MATRLNPQRHDDGKLRITFNVKHEMTAADMAHHWVHYYVPKFSLLVTLISADILQKARDVPERQVIDIIKSDARNAGRTAAQMVTRYDMATATLTQEVAAIFEGRFFRR